MNVFVRKDDGTEVDVTEGVQALYDHTVTSMDWGSGFFELDDALGIIKVALTCGFLVPESAQETFETYARTMMAQMRCLDCEGRVLFSYARSNRGWHHGDPRSIRYGDPIPPQPDHAVRIWPES